MKKFGDFNYSKWSSVDGGYTIYSVYGEDPNCDMGGSHICLYLGDVEGTFQEVLEYAANNMSRFYTWGGGGYITPSIKNNEPIIVNESKKLKLERKETLKKLTKANVNYLIENMDNMNKDEIKNYLIEILKNS